MARAIGIDLGTTYTVVGTLEGGRPMIVPNAEGQCLTPSVVAFVADGAPLVGEAARSQAGRNPERTVFSIKRRMGSEHRVRVGAKEYTPQEVSSFILRKVKADAESYLGEAVRQAVITVPAYFNDRQRQATREAGVLAGLEVMRLLSEPTAAALAYGLHREDVQTVAVWDLGGGTFDISILDLGEGIFEVRAVSGDTWLGGDDFDERLADHLAGEYQRSVGRRFPEDGGSRQRLREAAEGAKIQLSTAWAARVRVLAVEPGEPSLLETEVTRQQFQEVTSDLVQRMVPPARQALRDAGLAPQEVDRVVLAGGATRMPAVRALVREMFGREPYRSLNPDEVVARGAVIQAGMLLGHLGKVVLLDVLPLSLGVETQGGLMARIIPRNTPLPASEARIFTTAADGQTCMDIHVLQGERELASHDISLGQVRLSGIPSACRGVPKVEVAFEADVDGIVRVTAKDLWTESKVEEEAVASKALDWQEVEDLAREAETRAEEDRQRREGVQAGIEASNVLAAGEGLLGEVRSAEEGPWAEELAAAVVDLRESMAKGGAAEMRRRSSDVRRLLAARGRARGEEAEGVASMS